MPACSQMSVTEILSMVIFRMRSFVLSTMTVSVLLLAAMKSTPFPENNYILLYNIQRGFDKEKIDR